MQRVCVGVFTHIVIACGDSVTGKNEACVHFLLVTVPCSLDRIACKLEIGESTYF